MFIKPAWMMAAALTAFAIAPPAGAAQISTPASDPDLITETVPLAGVDLGTERGARHALYLIRVAAYDVCGLPYDAGPAWAREQPNSCVVAAMNRAVAKLDNPMLTALNGGFPYSGAQIASGR